MHSSQFQRFRDPGASPAEAAKLRAARPGRGMHRLRAIVGAWALVLAPPALAQTFDATAREVFEGASRVTATDEHRCTLDVTDLNGAAPATIFLGHIVPSRTRISSVSLDGAIFSSLVFSGDDPVLCLRSGQCLTEVESRIVADEYDRKRLVATLVHLFTAFCPGAATKDTR